MKIFVNTFLFFMTLIMTTVSFAQSEYKPEIILSSAIEVSPRKKITAYDLVESRHLSEETMEELKNIQLGDQTTKYISKSDFIKSLRNIDSKYRLPTEIKLLRSQSNVSRMEVERKIKNHLMMKCYSCEYTLLINSVPQAMTADWDLDLNIDFNKTSVMVPVFSTTQPDKKGWVVVEVRKYAMAPTLNRPLKVGDVVTASMITVEKRLINRSDILIDTSQVIGLQANRFLNAGQLLSDRDLKKEQVMKKGQMVKALFGQQSLQITISAQADEAGAIGDVIRVKNLDSQRMFAARIVDRGLVEIE